MRASRRAPNGLEHRFHDYPIRDVAHVLNLHHSNALVDDRCAVLRRGHSDDHLCVNAPDRHDAAHRFADALDDHRNCVRDLDDHHRHVDDLDANRDLQTCHQLKDGPNLDDRMMDGPNLDDRMMDGPMTDGRDRLGDHRHDVDVLGDRNRNCADDLDGRHHDVVVPDGQSQNCADDLDGRRRGVAGTVVNRHDEGLWLQRHLGELDGLNHYLVLGDADRFCLV